MDKLIVVKGKRNGVEFITTEERFDKMKDECIKVKDYAKPKAKAPAKPKAAKAPKKVVAAVKPKVDSGVKEA